MSDSRIEEFPAAPAAEAPADSSPLRFIEGELRRPAISPGYRASLVLVSLATVLLPVVYFALIGLLLYGIFYYATNCSGILQWPVQSPSGVIVKFLLYAVPYFIGFIFVFFLIKPLFAPKHLRDGHFSLNHADAPQLFALVGWICRSLEAPIPSRIDVNHSVNAGAELRSIRGNDIVLELGLSLAAGMNLSQFAGVIAHEYGHFSQGGAMRARALARRVNLWFYRVVYERDKWDFALIVLSERDHHGLFVVLAAWLARFGIWLGRRILWILMWIGHALNSLLARQMEFNADQYEIAFVGSETFINGMRRIRQLNLGMVAAMKRLRENWNASGKLFDQLPDLVVSCANEIPAESQGRLHAAISARRTRLFDSHPSDAERIKQAVAAAQPGIFHSDAAATTLFANFPELARRATLLVYKSVLGRELPADSLISTEQSALRVKHDPAADGETIERYFLGVPTTLRPVFITENKTVAVRLPEPLVAAVRSSRAAMNRLLPAAQAAYARVHQNDSRLLLACQAAQLLKAGFLFEPADFNLAGNEPEPAQREAERELRAASAELTPFEDAARARMSDTVQLLRLCPAIAAIPDATRLQERATQFVWVLSRLEPVFEPVLELRQDCAALDILLRYRRRHIAADNLDAALEELSTGIQERVNSIQQQTEAIRYPFEHPAGQILVSQYLRNTEFHADPFELALREGNSVVEKSVALHQRLLSGLVLICEEVERHVLP